MKTTNIHNLPAAIVKAVTREGDPKPDRLSVTDLINPPLQRFLKHKHWNEIEEDASDKLWMLLGSAVHYVLEKGAHKSTLSEVKIEKKVGQFTIVGIPDLYDNEKISDYKITSAYSFLLGDKPEWEAQLNCYAYLFRHCGFEVKSLEINAILRDWQKSKSLSSSDYPNIPFQQVDIALWTPEKAEIYINDRVAMHSALPMECTPQEKWERPTTYACMKDGRKSAVRVFPTLEEAEALQKTDNKLKIEVRQGANIRCQNYCSVSNFCQYRGE